MPGGLSTLSYETREPSQRQLRLVESTGSARLEYALAPSWAVPLLVTYLAVIGAGCFWMLLYIISEERRTLLGLVALPKPMPAAIDLQVHQLLRQAEWSAGISLGVPCCMMWAGAAYALWKQRKFGQIPKTLTADAVGITKRWTGWLSLRERRWPAAGISSVELESGRGVHLWGAQRNCLAIHRHRKWTLRFALPTRDSSLPGRIAEAFSRVLVRPCSHSPVSEHLTAPAAPPIVGQ